MMDGPSHTSERFPAQVSALVLTVVAAVLALGAASLAGRLSDHPPAARQAALYGAAVIWAAMLAGLLPLPVAARHGTQGLIVAYFLGMAVRLVVCISAGLAGVYWFHLSSPPMLLTMAGLYLPLLLVEVVFISRFLARQDRNASAARLVGR